MGITEDEVQAIERTRYFFEHDYKEREMVKW